MMIDERRISDKVTPNSEYCVYIRPVDSNDYSEVYVYNAKVRSTSHSTSKDNLDPDNFSVENMGFCSFSHDFNVPIEVVISSLTPYCNKIKIFPSDLSIAVSKQKNEHHFILSEPQKLSIEFDGDFYHNLFLFAELPDDRKPNTEDDNVIYFPAGVYDAGEIKLSSNQTLYLEEGAYVYGLIRAKNADNITICGKGIICGEKYIHDLYANRSSLCVFNNCNNLTIRDVTLLDSPAWTCAIFNSNNIRIDNVKEITYNYCSDGFDICGCSNLIMTNVFARNCDDCISIKSYGPNNRNIVIKDSVFWNDCAHALLVGPESAKDNDCIFEDILFENIKILFSWEYNTSFMGVMSIMCTDNAHFKNIKFSNILIERNDYGKLISVKYATNYASTIGKSIENITFENIRYSGPMALKSTLFGTDAEHTIRNLRFKNFFINGRPLTNKNIFIESNEFAEIIYENE